MNERIRIFERESHIDVYALGKDRAKWEATLEKFAELIVRECVNREELLGAIARGWCSEKNSHKTMDSDLALAIFDEVEKQIRQQFGVE
jgi:hypothetical protein